MKSAGRRPCRRGPELGVGEFAERDRSSRLHCERLRLRLTQHHVGHRLVHL
jgi:hypothetical protein